MIKPTIEAKFISTNEDKTINMAFDKKVIVLSKDLTFITIGKEVFSCTYATTKNEGYVFFIDLGNAVCIDTNEKTAKDICFIFGLKVTKEVKEGEKRSFLINKALLKNDSGAVFGWNCGEGFHRKGYAITYAMFEILKGSK